MLKTNDIGKIDEEFIVLSIKENRSIYVRKYEIKKKKGCTNFSQLFILKKKTFASFLFPCHSGLMSPLYIT